MTRCPTALLLLGSLTGCATLGGTVKGDFACRAPTGTCAPMTAIDAQAVTSFGAGQPGKTLVTPARTPLVSRGGPAGARTGERLLDVLLPAHVDAAGILHDAATVHIVVESPAWRVDPSRPSDDGKSLSEFSRSPAPSSLREAVAGASASAIEGLESLPARAPHLGFDDRPALPASGAVPSAAAIAAAKNGHRIGQGNRVTPPGPSTASVNLPAGRTIVPAGDPAEALDRIRAGLAPALAAPGKPPAPSVSGDSGDPFGVVPSQEKQP